MNKDLIELILPTNTLGSHNLKPEQKICIEFANAMRDFSLTNKIQYVWFHIPNEFLPSTRINYSFELKLKHMGKIAGTPDYCFVGHNNSFFIEFKAEKRKQTSTQIAFEKWCVAQKISYFLCHSAKQGIDLVLSQNKLKNIN
jgi:hypothetical protein